MSDSSHNGAQMLPGVFGASPLPPGAEVAEFEIEEVIGEGGFSIVYLAVDRVLRRSVALKEYFPNSIAIRRNDLSIAPSSPKFQETFDAGLKSFVNEAQLLASFDHPALVKVYRFWEKNQTAYMAMKLYRGPTLKSWLKSRGSAPEEEWILNFTLPIMDAAAQLHRQNCLHRDIAPDNILVLEDSAPLLLDFGAARRIIGEATQNLTVILKPGYAPFEQYSEESSLRQGPWTDVYALAAVMYFLIAGKTPVSSVSRAIRDELRPATEIGSGRYSAQLLSAIDAGLRVSPDQRPQSMAEFQRLLLTGQQGGPLEESLQVAFVSEIEQSRPATLPRVASTHAPMSTQPPLGSVRTGAAKPQSGPEKHRRLLKLKTVLAVAVLTSFASYAFLVWKQGVQPRIGGSTAVTDPSRSTESAPNVAILSNDQTKTAPNGNEGIPRVPSVEPHREQPPEPPLLGTNLLAAIYQLRSPDISVTLTPRAAKNSRFTSSRPPGISASASGYVYVLAASPASDEIRLVLPNSMDANNRMGAGREFELSDQTWKAIKRETTGQQLLIVVFRQRREFNLDPSTSKSPFKALVTPLQSKSSSRGAGVPLSFEALARCHESESVCEGAFGAASLDVPPTLPVEVATKRLELVTPALQGRPVPPSLQKEAVEMPAAKREIDEYAAEREKMQEQVRKLQQENAEAVRRAEQAERDREAQKALEEQRRRDAEAAERERQKKKDAEEAAARQNEQVKQKEQEAAKKRPTQQQIIPSF